MDSGVITEETRSAIQEAWEGQLNEAREEVRAELREEFARRYEHDKDVMVEALNSMVTDQLGSHIQAIAEEKAPNVWSDIPIGYSGNLSFKVAITPRLSSSGFVG